jgi:hypothetical protein
MVRLEEGIEANLINLAHKVCQLSRFTKKRLIAGVLTIHIQKHHGLK